MQLEYTTMNCLQCNGAGYYRHAMERFNCAECGATGRKVCDQTEIAHRIRNNALLNRAYREGSHYGMDELEVLRRFTLTLLSLKDEAIQQKIDDLYKSPSPIFHDVDADHAAKLQKLKSAT